MKTKSASSRKKRSVASEARRLSQFFNALPIGVYACDGEGNIVFHNKRAVELWGRDPSTEKDCLKFCACYQVFKADGTYVAPENTPMAIAVRQGRAFQNVEAIVVKPDGTRFSASVNIDVIRDDAGEIVGTINAFQDITGLKNAIRHDAVDHKQTEETLRKRGERLQLLSDTLGQLLRARDPDTIVRELFPKVASHLGVDTYFNFMVSEKGDFLTLHSCAGIPEEAARAIKRLEFGQSICGFVAETRQGMHATDIQNSGFDKAELVRGFGIQSYACNPLIVGDRLLGTLSFASRTRKAFDQDELQFLEIISQYTAVALDRLRSAEQLEKAVAQRTASLQEAVAQLEEFSYTISHDLRAPLRGIRNYSDVLLEEHAAAMPADALFSLQRISANARLLDKMVVDVLAFSRVARADLRLEKVALEELVRLIVEQYPGLQSPDAHVEIEPLPAVLGHEASLTQVFSNLLQNAVKFVPPTVKPKIRIWSERKDRHVRLWVSDNGIGVDPKYQHRLFRMFERIHPNMKYEGTGVGLAIVRKAVERMGGRVGIQSDGVQGSNFWVDLPRPE